MKKKILLLVLSILAISQLTYSASDPRIERLLRIAKQKQAAEFSMIRNKKDRNEQ